MRKKIAILAAVLAAVVSFLVATSSSSNATPNSAGTCSGSYVSATFTTVTVPAGGYCRLSDSTVTGSVIVNKNASFETCGTYIGGSITSTQAYLNLDYTTTVVGSIDINKAGAENPSLQVECSEVGQQNGYAAFICPHFVGGGIAVHDGPNSWQEVEIGECGPMTIGGSVAIQNNRLPVELEFAHINGALLCINNNPSPFTYENVVRGAVVGCRASTPTLVTR